VVVLRHLLHKHTHTHTRTHTHNHPQHLTAVPRTSLAPHSRAY
jgi:hypothetical protein